MRKRRTHIFILLLVISFSVQASTVFLPSGRWSEVYSKNTVETGTKVVITGHVTVDIPLLILGSIEIAKGASLSGLKPVYIAPAGSLHNEGNIVLKSLLNRGQIVNNGIIDLMYDLENEGILQNNHLINCARSFYCHGGTLGGGNSRYYIGEFYRISDLVNIDAEELLIKMPEEY